jgi:hypothetical protein
MLTRLIVLGMVSCLKDKDYDDGLIQSVHNTGQPKMVEIKATASPAANFLTFSFDPLNKDTTLNFIPINLSTSGPGCEFKREAGEHFMI